MKNEKILLRILIVLGLVFISGIAICFTGYFFTGNFRYRLGMAYCALPLAIGSLAIVFYYSWLICFEKGI